MTFSELKDKAGSLPLAPGVYIMRDKTDKVIYVGKAKKLKNRVSQYFHDSVSHSPKTRKMVSCIQSFDVIVADSEFEALVLECSLIKRYSPHYNILLKDDKGYPFVRLSMKEPYPRITLVNRIADDGAEYFGPYGSRGITQCLIEAIQAALRFPACNKQFPRDIGKGRPCLNYHMGQCAGWCQQGREAAQYRQTAERARQLLNGNYKAVSDEIRNEMLQAAESLNFELAASLRDRYNAVQALGQKQFVTAGASGDVDVIGYGQTESKACFTVLHFSGGNLVDKDYEILPIPDDRGAALSALVKQYYLSRGYSPKTILLPFSLEDSDLFSRLFEKQFQRKTRVLVPQRGDNVRLIELAQKNAQEEAERITGKEERRNGTLLLLSKMLSIETAHRIESYDISNISGTDTVASMVVFIAGASKKQEYKRFKVNDLDGQDDYGAMRQVLIRRFSRYIKQDKGFDQRPNLLLIDGGQAHASVALDVLKRLELDIPVFGMVKDNRHRTRALVTPHGHEIRIDSQQSVFALIGTIQEETHRFAISYHRELRSKRLKYSQLDQIPGIGPKRKQDLIREFKSIQAIKNADLPTLKKLLPQNAALAVYNYFRKEDSGCE